MRKVPTILLSLVLLRGQPLPAAPPDWSEITEAARSLGESRGSGEKAVLDALEARAGEVLGRLVHPLGPESWGREVPRLRQRLAASLGVTHLPEPVPRNLRSVGTLQRGDHVVEKLVYETFPGTEVPAHLYRPIRVKEKLPAVLFVPGHWWADSKTRPDFQAFCINMARWGYLVLTYDPVGQGERGISWRDHRRTCSLLVGVAQQAIVDFESLCALEVLLSRPGVDPKRVGITGASGGGYNSWILAALDPRIAVSVPVVGTSEFKEQIRVCRPLDWYQAKEHCHFVPGLLQYANNHELLAMAAPRPVLVVSAHRDQSFPLPGIREVVAYGKELYASLGVAERFGYFEDARSGHGYQKEKREATYGWLLRWLKKEGNGSPFPEPPTKTAPWNAEELRCFPAGENRPAGPGIVKEIRAILESLPQGGEPPTARGLERSVLETLGIPIPTSRLLSGPKLERGPGRTVGGTQIERVRWQRRDGVVIPGILLAPAGSLQGALLAASDDGKESLLDHPAVRTAVESRLAVLLADPRGLGENATTREGWVFAVSLLLGESFVGLQALDLLTGWRGLRALPELNGKPIGLLGSGPFASAAALHAAVLEPRAAWLVHDGGFATYRSFVDRPSSLGPSYALAVPGEERTVRIDQELPHSLAAFNVLRRYDLPDLLASLAPRPVLVADAIDGDWRPLSGEALERTLRGGRFSWRSTPRLCVGSDTDRVMRVFSRTVSAETTPKAPIPETPKNVSTLIPRGRMPNRVHAVEDYETDIEKRWWMAGQLELENTPPGSRRACRGTLANDFDDKLGDGSRVYTSVIFNPVPGPPMGRSPRLGFRYWIRGTDTLRVQIYSLSRGYHRCLTLVGLEQGVWQTATVDLKHARRPDGSGGPLSEDERIDDIQFYTRSVAELIIDDIVLYEAGGAEETESFPRRNIFTGWFDTGQQGREWPGDFEIVDHAKPGTWKAARSVENARLGIPWIRLHLRGERPLQNTTRLRFRCWLQEADELRVSVIHGASRQEAFFCLEGLTPRAWLSRTLDLGDLLRKADEIRFFLPSGGSLLLDDVLLYEP